VRLRAILSAVLVVAATSYGLNWPIPPVDQPHPLGLNWGNYQDYVGVPPFLHWGIDVITPDTAGVEVRSVSHGWVKGWGTIEARLHYCLLVCDTSPDFTGRAEGWGYGHIDAQRFHKNEGDEVQEGELIGYLVDFPVDSSFDHLHFCRISDTGAYWHRFPNFTAWFVQNPLTIITPNTDLEPPVIENARGGDRFAFCRDNVDNEYLDADSLVGAVDIIARVYDKTGYTTGDTIWDKLAPFKLEHMIKRAGDDSVVRPWTLSLELSNLLDDSCVNVLYKDDDTCPSCGNYERREYYYIITNTDGDSVMERSDTTGNWNTAGVGAGDYWVIVRAWDVYGNSATDSMLVTVLGSGITAGGSRQVLANPLAVQPNPSLGPTRISFGIGKSVHVRLCVLDATGRVVAVLADHRLDPGRHRFQTRLPAGVYLVRAEFDGRARQSVKVVVAE
jgi:hypothetical protein